MSDQLHVSAVYMGITMSLTNTWRETLKTRKPQKMYQDHKKSKIYTFILSLACLLLFMQLNNYKQQWLCAVCKHNPNTVKVKVNI